jgi:hypothetical protein
MKGVYVGVVRSVVCLSVIGKLREGGGPGSTASVASWQKGASAQSHVRPLQTPFIMYEVQRFLI